MPNGYTELKKSIIKYNPDFDKERLDRAFELSSKGHKGQLRKSGDPYITHPIEVAKLLAQMEMDMDTIIAGILHDTIEDTRLTYEELVELMGEEVANLVEGVTKLGKISYTTKEERQAENLRKMFIAMAQDIRVILIKLADRLHNMRTLKYMSNRKQEEKAKETLEIYAPLAHRLGMSKIKWELEDLSLRYIDPKGYYNLVDKIATKRKEREEYISRIKKDIEDKTKNMGIEVYIDGRPKHFYSIYKKMKNQGKTIDQIYDLIAIRVIVNTVKECYAILGMVHEMYKPIPGRFKDYIAMPKPNMYQSLHSTVLGHKGVAFEIQIRTWEMHKIAEVGIAAHWKYKDGSTQVTMDDKKFAWLRQLLEWHKEMRDDKEFVETVKIDLFSDEVFVFTPKGDIINLPAGSTPIDFAYSIHSDIGNKMIGAKINGKIVPLEHKLSNGEIVEVMTSSSVSGPSRDWLNLVKSSQARNKIRQWFKKENREENIERGKENVKNELKKQGYTQSELFKTKWINKILKRYNFNTLDDIYAAIGYGAMTSNKVVSRLRDEYLQEASEAEKAKHIRKNVGQPKKGQETKPKKVKNKGVRVKGIDNCLVKLAKCCNPVPGDDIVGYITRGRGVSVHRKDCPNIINMIDGENRLIEVSWVGDSEGSYLANVIARAYDRSQLLMEITNTLGEHNISLKAINGRTTKDNIAVIELSLEIHSTSELNSIIKKIKGISGVFEVVRKKK